METRPAVEMAGPGGFPDPGDGGVTELVLVLPSAEAAALEREASRRGLTAGRLLRDLINDWLTRAREPAP